MATNGHPATPPGSDPSTTTKQDLQPPQQPSTLKTASNPGPDQPLTSTQDDGLSKRPRDARLIHVVLSSLGIHSYQERVPLQLLDFAYRYTSSVLSDSQRLASEGYSSTHASGKRQAGSGGGDVGDNITVTALRQAIASRQGHVFSGPLPKEFMMEQAAERNRIALPKVERGYGVALPPEKYCLTGVGWGLREEWESSEDERAEEEGGREEDEVMGGVDGLGEGEGEEDEEGAGRMEDVFGEEGGDAEMAD